MLDHWLGTEALQGIRWVLWGLTALLFWLVWTRPWRKADRALAVFFVLALSIALLAPTSFKGVSTGNRQEKAMAMWKERCQKAGEFIYQTVDDVESVYLMKLRPKEPNFGAQFVMDDPYGDDVYGMGLVSNFLRKASPPDKPPVTSTKGYRYVVAKNVGDGQLYRFTGGWVSTRKKDVKSPWIQDELKRNPKLDLNIYDFQLQRSPPEPLPRYGVTWDDISTREEREYWIAGSSLKVIDLQTNQVIAERIGYMVDWAQGSRAGNRSPWLFAADTACPAFRDPALPRVQPASAYRSGQTYRFVSKVLKPKQ